MRLVLPEAQLKAVQTSTGTRVLDFYAASFSETPDKHGDIFSPHAFDSWLKSFYAAGDSLPISFAHGAVLNSTDPAAIIGFAPADMAHVWTDDYGLRIKANLYTDNEKAMQVARLIDDGVVKGASLAAAVDDWTSKTTDVREITKAAVREAGPCMFPVNDQAVLLSLKASLDTGWLSVEQFQDLFQVDLKAVDNTGWDGNRAMGECNSASDYESICAGTHTVGQPGERQHYALPHHYLGKGPNADGVRAALSRVPQTANITDAERASARSHLEAHMSQINPQKTEELDDILVKSSPEYVQSTHDAAVRAGAACEHIEVKAEEEELSEQQQEALTKAEQVLEEATPLWSDEDREIQRRFRYLEITNGK
jgi:HK97 family phage prohead protease